MKRLALLLLLSSPVLADPVLSTHRLSPTLAELDDGAGGNIGVSFGDDGVLVIDDNEAELAPQLRAALDSLSKKPVRFVFNTHWHGDHTGGNLALAEHGATIVAQDAVRARLSTDQKMDVMTKKIPASPQRALPIVTFSSEMTFFFNGDVLHVFHVEHAHTDGDAIVRFEKANVVHAGDTYFTAGYPFVDVSSGGSIDGYLVAANRLLAVCDDDTRIIPGHGPMSNRRELVKWRDMIVTVRDRIAKMKAAGKSVDEVVRAKPTAEFDAQWGHWFMKPEMFVAMSYATVGKFPQK